MFDYTGDRSLSHSEFFTNRLEMGSDRTSPDSACYIAHEWIHFKEALMILWGDRPNPNSPKSDLIASLTPHASQNLAARLEETGKTGRFNEDRVIHLP